MPRVYIRYSTTTHVNGTQTRPREMPTKKTRRQTGFYSRPGESSSSRRPGTFSSKRARQVSRISRAGAPHTPRRARPHARRPVSRSSSAAHATRARRRRPRERTRARRRVRRRRFARSEGGRTRARPSTRVFAGSPRRVEGTRGGHVQADVRRREGRGRRRAAAAVLRGAEEHAAERGRAAEGRASRAQISRPNGAQMPRVISRVNSSSPRLPRAPPAIPYTRNPKPRHIN